MRRFAITIVAIVWLVVFALTIVAMAGEGEGVTEPNSTTVTKEADEASSPDIRGEGGGATPPAHSRPPSPYKLPTAELMEFRWLHAEERALQAEVAMAMEKIRGQRDTLLSLWKKRHKIKDLRVWRVDIATGTLRNKVAKELMKEK